jgi:hypothetical protein
MKYEKIKIETDGTTAGTIVHIDGERIIHLQNLEFSVDCKDDFTRLSIQVARTDNNGKLKTKKVKIRDQKTQRFVDSTEVETETLLLERIL